MLTQTPTEAPTQDTTSFVEAQSLALVTQELAPAKIIEAVRQIEQAQHPYPEAEELPTTPPSVSGRAATLANGARRWIGHHSQCNYSAAYEAWEGGEW